MTRHWVRGVVATIWSLLALTTSASAETSWVLWTQDTRIDLDRPDDPARNLISAWRYVDAFDSRAACKAGGLSNAATMAELLNKPVIDGRPDWSATASGSSVMARWIVTGVLARPGKQLLINYQCFPDTIAPRGPKAK